MSDKDNIAGNVVVITGTSSGLGGVAARHRSPQSRLVLALTPTPLPTVAEW